MVPIVGWNNSNTFEYLRKHLQKWNFEIDAIEKSWFRC